MSRIHSIASDRFRRLSKEGLWIVLGQGMSVVGALVGIRVLTESLNPTEYGELALGMTLANLVSQIILGPLGNGVIRFYAPAAEQGDLVGYLHAVRKLVGLTTGLIVLLMLISVAGLLTFGQIEWIAIVTAAFIFAILSGYNTILNGIQNAARQRSIVALHQGMDTWMRFMIAAGLLLWMGATSSVAMMGYAMANALILGSQWIFFRNAIPMDNPAIDQVKWQGEMWKYSLPFAIWGGFTWVQQASDRWALGLNATTQEVGLYAALFQLGYYPILMATAAVMQLLVPIFYLRAGNASDDRRNRDVTKLVWRTVGLILVLTGIAFLVVFLLHAQIFYIFVAADYASVSYLLPWVILAGGLFSAGQTITHNLMSQMKTHALIPGKIITALCGIALNFAGAYWYSVMGIVIAGVLFSVLYFLWMAMLSMKHHPKL